jgi:hypothetical protein
MAIRGLLGQRKSFQKARAVADVAARPPADYRRSSFLVVQMILKGVRRRGVDHQASP